MNVLLDTHAFIWLDSAPEKLSAKALAICQYQENTLFLSMANLWEMQIKHQLGKLNFKLPLNQLIEEQRVNNGLQILPIESEDIYALNELPLHHKDPFDRLILIQARLKNLHLVSTDVVFNRYDVDLYW